MGYSRTETSQRKPRHRSWDGYIGNLAPLGHGVSGMVFAIDDQRVAKIDTGSLRSLEDIKTEREVYRKLSSPGSPYVLRCYETDNPNGLVLERCTHTIRKRLRSHYNGRNPPEHLAKQWAFEAASGLAYIHRHGVIQGDVGCHNMLLSPKNDTVKLADFAGSSIDGSPWATTVDYEHWSKLPGSDEPNQTTDLFALGSAVYEMATGSPPYENKSWREIYGLYKRAKFPDVKSIRHLGPIILKCWNQEYKTADQVVHDMEYNSKLDLRRENSNVSEDSSVVEPSSSQKLGRQPATRDKYVDFANDRRKSRKQGPDVERVQEKTRPRKEGRKNDDRGSVSFLARSFNWLKPSYSYQIKVN